jgi:hypothetical protein
MKMSSHPDHESVHRSNLPSSSLGMDAAERGAALIVVLAFVAMLLVLLMAFFSKSTLQQQVSKSSVTLGLADIFAQGAIDTIIGDLKQEIFDGSVPVTNATGTDSNAVTTVIYYPATNLNAVPQLVGCATNTNFPNLIKISTNLPFYSLMNSAGSQTAGVIRATTNSSTNSSVNGRLISSARWNKPLFLKTTNTLSAADLTPASTFVPPSWILLSRSGTNPRTWDSAMQWSANNSSTVIGRYAYSIYNEGGVLDVNVAGYPQIPLTSISTNAANLIGATNHMLSNAAAKTALSYADLTNLPYVFGGTSLYPFTNNALLLLLNWRNAATLQATGPSNAATGQGISNYVTMVAAATNGFLSSAPTNSGTNTDRQFVNRQQLISFFMNRIGASSNPQLLNMLPYLGTFSRGIEQPSYVPATNRPKVLDPSKGGTLAYGNDDKINPPFLSVRVTNSFTVPNPLGVTETHNVGDPLVKKRFPLNRLVWLTYAGPSANRTVPSSSNSTSAGTDQDMWLLVNKYGISTNFLAQGTAANIQRYFGLSWNSSSNCWTYVHNGTNSGSGAIMKLSDVAALSGAQAREADFFELLKATIGVGSLGNALLKNNTTLSAPSGAVQGEVPENWQYSRDASVDGQIIQIGANIINQSRCDNFPILINFNDGSLTNRQFAGVANLPYIANVVNGLLQIKQPNKGPYNAPGGDPLHGEQYIVSNSDTTYGLGSSGDPGLGAVMQFPILWNPHSKNSAFPATGIRPSYFRVVADSTTPDNVDTGANYWQVITYAKSGTTGVIPVVTTNGTNITTNYSGTNFPITNTYSYLADGSSPTTVGGVSLTGLYTPSATALTAANSGLQFQIANNTLFREPTVLCRPGFPTGSSLQVSSSNRISDAPVSSFLISGGLPSSVSDPCGFGNISAAAATNFPANTTPYLGFYLGSYPLRWIALGTDGQKYAMASSCTSGGGGGVYVARYKAANDPGYHTPCYFTYRVQYATNSSGPWYTYDTKYGKYYGGNKDGWNGGTNGTQLPMVGYIGNKTLFNGYDKSIDNSGAQMSGDSGYWCTAIDPRTGRFGLVTTAHDSRGAGGGAGHGFSYGWRSREANFNPVSLAGGNLFSYWGWLDYINGVTGTLRPFAQAGSYSDCWMDFQANMPRWNFQQWFVNYKSDSLGLMVPLGSFEQNNSDSWTSMQAAFTNTMGACQVGPFYYADPDGVVRRAAGAYVPRIKSLTDTNFPLVQNTTSTTIYNPITGNQTFDKPNLAPACTTVGLPLARATTNSTTPLAIDGTQTIISNSFAATTNYCYQDQSRPYFLNRPYRTVAELGCVFRDTPWKNLDFFTPESADNALLDVFSISENVDPSGLVAGKVDLNTRQQPVLQAILSGGALDDSQTGLGLNTPAAFATNAFASNVAAALVYRTTNTANPTNGPLMNPAELVGRYLGSNAVKNVQMQPIIPLGANVNPSVSLLTAANGFCDGKLSYAGFSGGLWDSVNGAPLISSPVADITSAADASYAATNTLNGVQETVKYVQRFHEAPIRALVASGQTRVWNLMIDVVAQTGRYPASATGMDNFMVEGEQRYWVHLAIDRLTGQVLDKQIEVVKE